jgi:hypothetical protein
MFGTTCKVACCRSPRATGIGLVEQAIEQALDEPLGHGLAGMLPADDPHGMRPGADDQCVEVASQHRRPEAAQPGTARAGAGQQVQMALP